MQWKEDSVIPFDGTGTFAYTATSVAPTAVGATVISSAHFNTFSADISDALTLCLTQDGNNTAAANLPMGANKHTGCAVGVDSTDYMTYGQAGQLRTTIVEIGTWDMVALDLVTVPHVLTGTKIRNVQAFIRDDAAGGARDLLSWGGAQTGGAEVLWDSTNITLRRGTDGYFDTTSYDTMGDDGNRGYITIQYTD